MADETAPLPKLTDKQAAFVSSYIGTARMNATEAARLAGYKGTRDTLRVVGCENLSKPNIAAAIQEWRAEVRRQGIADVEHRVANLDSLLVDLYRVKQERADEWAELAQSIESKPHTQKTYDEMFGGIGTRVPAGAGTGLVVRQIKMIGTGPSARIVEEFGIDTALFDRIVKAQDEAAKELGQRTDNLNLSGSLTREYVVVRDNIADENHS